MLKYATGAHPPVHEVARIAAGVEKNKKPAVTTATFIPLKVHRDNCKTCGQPIKRGDSCADCAPWVAVATYIGAARRIFQGRR